MSQSAYVILLLILLFGLGGLGGVFYRLWMQQRREIQDLSQSLSHLEAAVSAIIAGASGSDRRSGKQEQRLLQLQRRLEDLEETRNTERPYDDAIRLVRQGANVQRLMEELGLSRNEADLLLMLHGGGKADTGSP